MIYSWPSSLFRLFCSTAIVVILFSSSVIALEEEQEIDFTVTLLGTGTPVSGAHQFGASILVQAGGNSYVFDCGRGCGIRLQEVMGIREFHRADTLFLTHLHSDHFVGIPEMYLNGWAQGRKKPFRVFGPTSTSSMMSNLKEAFKVDIGFRKFEFDVLETPEVKTGVEINSMDIKPGVVLNEDGVKVTAFLVEHKHVTPAYGFRIDYMGKSVVISGDTAYSENLINHSQGADVLIHEIMSPALVRALEEMFDEQEQIDFIVDIHTTVPQAIKVFNKVKPRLAVYYHTNNTKKNTLELLKSTAIGYPGKTVVGYDLMQINVAEKITVQ
jgi:ribonuclease Z